MATKSVIGKVTDAANQGVKGVIVKAFLSQGAVVSGTSEVPPFTVSATSASDGTYSLTLQANNDLTPNGTYYRIDEGGYQYNIVVPQSAGPFPISTIQVDVPPLATPSAQHVASLVVDTSITAGTLIHAGTLQVDTGPLVVPAASIAESAVTGLVADLASKATDSLAAHLAGTETFTGVKVFSAAPTFSLGANFPSGAGVVFFGGGDDVTYYVPGTAYEMDARQGTAAAPITAGAGPTFKISRTESITAASMPAGIGANNQGNAALWCSATGDVNNQAQVNAGLFTSISFSTQTRTGGVDIDACGLNAQAAIQGSGTGVAIGAYVNGRRDTATGTNNGLEVRSTNSTATDDPFVTNGPSKTMGVWITAGGSSPSAVACTVGAFTAGQTWHVGYAVMSTAVTDAAFRDESQASFSHLINGTHATAAIAVANGSGPVLIGEIAAQSSQSLLEVWSASGTSHDPLANFGSVGSNDNFSMRLKNATGTVYFAAIAGGSNAFLSGTATGDAVRKVATAGKADHWGGTAKVITVTGGDLLGFFAKAPVGQQNTTGTATGFTAGAGTAVQDVSTFTGGTGATAYRISDIVLALKNYGLLAA